MNTIRRIERITVGETEILALVDGASDYLPITEAFRTPRPTSSSPTVMTTVTSTERAARGT